jgi:HAD-superfamily hydrolase, subfamily IIB
MKFDIKLIMTDLDGTLLTNDKRVTERTRAAIIKARDKGIVFGIATGRTLFAVERLIIEWGIADIVDIMMGMNGAQRWDFIKDYKETTDYLAGDYMIEILDKTQSLEAEGVIYKDDTHELIVERITPEIETLGTNNHYTPKIANLRDYLRGKEYEKLILCCHPDYMDKVKEFCAPLDCENYRGFCTGEILYEFMKPIVSKSYGISKICEHYDYDIQKVLVFGDNSNDIEMIKDAGVGVCMINGSADAKAVAKCITEYSNEEDGLARFIEDYIL